MVSHANTQRRTWWCPAKSLTWKLPIFPKFDNSPTFDLNSNLHVLYSKNQILPFWSSTHILLSISSLAIVTNPRKHNSVPMLWCNCLLPEATDYTALPTTPRHSWSTWSMCFVTTSTYSTMPWTSYPWFDPPKLDCVNIKTLTAYRS